MCVHLFLINKLPLFYFYIQGIIFYFNMHEKKHVWPNTSLLTTKPSLKNLHLKKSLFLKAVVRHWTLWPDC